MPDIKDWISATRPKTLAAALVPVALGSACAGSVDRFQAGPALLALAFAILAQITCNLANDYFDFKKGADTPERLGPERLTASGKIPPEKMRMAMQICCALAFLTGLSLLPFGGWILLPVGVLSLLAAVGYTAGPFPLAYLGLGDVFVVVFFGFVATPFSAYVQCGTFPTLVWPAAFGCGLLANGILIVNNARDLSTDALAGKRTTAVRFGLGFSKMQYALTLTAALLAPVTALWLEFRVISLLPLALLPVGVKLIRDFYAVKDARAFNPLLPKTAALLTAWGLLFSVGIALAS